MVRKVFEEVEVCEVFVVYVEVVFIVVEEVKVECDEVIFLKDVVFS